MGGQQVDDLAQAMVHDADPNDRAFVRQFVGTMMFNAYVEENSPSGGSGSSCCEVRSEGDENNH